MPGAAHTVAQDFMAALAELEAAAERLASAFAEQDLTSLPDLEAATSAEGMLQEADTSASRPQVCRLPCSLHVMWWHCMQ